MVNFKDLKKQKSDNFEKLTKALADQNQGRKNEDDEKYWKPTVDKAGNGYAVIRFLPASKDEDIPFVRIWDHGFQGPGGWYIEKSLTTIGKDDPVSEFNSQLWNSTTDEESPERKQARTQKRRLGYISNVYIVSDPGKPENNGKVFLYKYGKKIFGKLNDLMSPEFPDDEAVNPFDLWEGANFKLKIRKVDGYQNYDKSEFDDPAPLLDDDKELEKVWESQHSLTELIDPKNFKSYADLKKRFEQVLGDPRQSASRKPVVDEDGEEAAAPPPKQKAAAAKPAKSAPAKKAPVETDEDEDEEGLDYFTKLASEDDEE